MAIDWGSKVVKPTVAVFGDQVLYEHASGGLPYAITGVFDEQYRDTEVQGPEVPVADRLPVLGVDVGQFKSEPEQNDRVIVLTVDGRPLATPKTYLVKIPRPDGHGHVRLMLNEAAW